MKSFQQFLEDTQQLRQGLRTIDREDRLSTRSQQLAQSQRDRASQFQQRSLANAAAQKEKQQAALDRQNMKREIKKELQSEELTEGKKKELVSAYLAGRAQAEPQVMDFGDYGEPNSPERTAALKRLMKYNGASAIKKAQKQKVKQAKKAAKRILQTEQTPSMDPNRYNELIAGQQAARKRTRETHAQTEMGHEAQSQLAAKQRRLRAIMSR